MTTDTDQYVTLISSLPGTDGLFKAKLPPLSRLKLHKRLKSLTPGDRERLELVENCLEWKEMNEGFKDAAILKRGKALFAAVRNKTLKRLILERLELRTLILAMRKRKRGETAPSETGWGFGRWQQHIARHWHEPDFSLSNVFDWANEANQLIQQEHAFKLEKLLLEVSYKQLLRHSGNHEFDFEAVVIYVMKWNIINRSINYNSHKAERRFTSILAQELARNSILPERQTSMENNLSG